MVVNIPYIYGNHYMEHWEMLENIPKGWYFPGDFPGVQGTHHSDPVATPRPDAPAGNGGSWWCSCSLV